jgi:hypothetical protein
MAWATADGTAIANSTAEALVFPDQTVPANYMQDGRGLKLRATGKYSTTSTPTLRLRLRWGGLAGTLLADTTAITCPSAVTNALWVLDMDIITRVNGSSGSLYVNGLFFQGSSTIATTVSPVTAGGFTAPATASVNLIADTALSLTGTWGTASASNTTTGIQYTITSIN